MSGRPGTANSSPIGIWTLRRNFCARCLRIFTRDIDTITMDELHARLCQRNFARRFACFTFDDGYRDNRDFALSIMREFKAPFTVHVASDCLGPLW
jgi:hypothetical protein